MKISALILLSIMSVSAFASMERFRGVDQDGNTCDLSIDLPMEEQADGKYRVDVKVTGDSKTLNLESKLYSARSGSLYLQSVITAGMPMFSKVKNISVYFDKAGTPISYEYYLSSGGFNPKVLKQVKCNNLR